MIIRKFLEEQRTYFRSSRNEIAIRNLEFARSICCIVLFINVLFYTGTVVFFKQWSISPCYLLCIPVIAVYLVLIRMVLQKKNFSVNESENLVLAMYVSLAVYVIILSIYPHPEVPSVYFPLFLTIAPVLFIMPIWEHLLVIVPSGAVFWYLVIVNKPQSVWPHELFEAATAFLLSLCMILIMTQFRLQGEKLKEKYHVLSQTDELTGLYNKTYGLYAAEQYLEEHRGRENMVVLFADIDNFREINNTYGHLEGDSCLKIAAEALKEGCRKSDIVCRFGGDEFIAFIPDITDEEVFKRRTGVIIDSLNHVAYDRKYKLSFSIGMCFAQHPTQPAEYYIGLADSALYQVKNSGKDGVHVVRC